MSDEFRDKKELKEPYEYSFLQSSIIYIKFANGARRRYVFLAELNQSHYYYARYKRVRIAYI